MKKPPILLATAALLTVCGLWLTRSPGWTRTADDSPAEDGTMPHPPPTHQEPILRPPEPNRRFLEFTPEQRVEFARRGHGPGG